MNMDGGSGGRGGRHYNPTLKQRRMQQNIMNSFTSGEEARDGVLPPRPKAPSKPVNAPVFADSGSTTPGASILQKCTDKIKEIDEQVTKTKSNIDTTMKLMQSLKGKSEQESETLRARLVKNLSKFTTAYEALLKRKRQEILNKKTWESRIAQSRKGPAKLQSEALDRDLDLYQQAGRKRSKAAQNQILDLRPAILKVMNVHSNMNELLLKAHFQNFGETMTVDIKKDVAYVKFKNRTEAEEALRSGGKLPNFMNGVHQFQLELTDSIPESDAEDEITGDTKLDKAFDDL